MTEIQQIQKQNEGKLETEKEIIKDIEKSGVPEEIAKKEIKLDEKSTEKLTEKNEEEMKKPGIKDEKNKIKRKKAMVKSFSLHISTKHSIAICNFIRNKAIERAINDLEQVITLKKVVPMKGEIPHKKGRKISSGRYPKKAAEHFIKLLKSLLANSNTIDLNNPIIVEAISNLASRPYGKFGRVKRKRTHVKIVASERKKSDKLNKKRKKINGRKKHS